MLPPEQSEVYQGGHVAQHGVKIHDGVGISEEQESAQVAAIAGIRFAVASHGVEHFLPSFRVPTLRERKGLVVEEYGTRIRKDDKVFCFRW